MIWINHVHQIIMLIIYDHINTHLFNYAIIKYYLFYVLGNHDTTDELLLVKGQHRN
jgi:hypothetical protein